MPKKLSRFARFSIPFCIFVIVLKSVNGIVGGPTVGIFTLGLFFPWVSQVPAVIGLILGLACAIWVFICSKVKFHQKTFELYIHIYNYVYN